MKVNSTLEVLVFPEDVDEAWPDFTRRYGITVVRPDQVSITFHWHWDQDGYEVQRVIASGQRVLKNGQVNDQRFDETFYSYHGDDWPGWIKRAIARAWLEARA